MTETACREGKPGRKWRLRLLAGVLVALAIAWISGFVWYARDVPSQIADVSTPTDAIVVLTGGSERLGAGLQLLRQRLGKKLFISGVYRGVEIPELLRLWPHTPEDVACCIVLGHAADNTVGNAVETAAWMRAEDFHSLRLVTGNYHMRRSLLEFRRAMPDIVVIPHPVFPDKVRPEEWWLRPGTAALIASEYDKYLAARLRHAIEALEEP